MAIKAITASKTVRMNLDKAITSCYILLSSILLSFIYNVKGFLSWKMEFFSGNFWAAAPQNRQGATEKRIQNTV